MRLLPYILRRVGYMLVVLWIVVTATFILMRSIPGGPFDRERALDPSVIAAIQRRYKLNDPLWRQYLDYLVRLAHLDLGPSLKYQGRSVNDIIAESFPVSARLGFLSILLSLSIGVPVGILCAMRRNGAADHVAMIGAIGLVSVPSFVLASLLIFLFANPRLRFLHFLPATWGGGAEWIEGGVPLVQQVKRLVIPVVSLAGFSLAYIIRLSRACLIEALGQDYIRTARSKGLSAALVAVKHALPNALAPVATYLGPLVAGVFTGSFVIERIYNIPGLGRYFVTSIDNRDYPVILGVTVFYCSFLVVMNLIVDLIYPLLDPRVTLGRKA